MPNSLGNTTTTETKEAGKTISLLAGCRIECHRRRRVAWWSFIAVDQRKRPANNTFTSIAIEIAMKRSIKKEESHQHIFLNMIFRTLTDVCVSGFNYLALSLGQSDW
jgi:hypothetical protein